jgi:hypothetical protein
MKGLESYFLIEYQLDLEEFLGIETKRDQLLIHVQYLHESLEICHQPTKVFEMRIIYELSLIDAAISESECSIIARNHHLKDLKVLNLSCNPFGSKGFQNLMRDGKNCLKKLEKIILYDCGIKSFDESKMIKLEKLKHLNLSYNKIG